MLDIARNLHGVSKGLSSESAGTERVWSTSDSGSFSGCRFRFVTEGKNESGLATVLMKDLATDVATGLWISGSSLVRAGSSPALLPG